MAPEQQTLPFPPPALRRVPFVEGAANADAIARLAAWRSGLARAGRPLAFAITGAPGSGKTMLLEREGKALGATLARPGADAEAVFSGEPSAVTLDDADGWEPLDLFAAIEAAARARIPLLLAGAAPLAGWAGPKGARLPDLESRLRSIVHAPLSAPDEAMLAQLLAGQLKARGLAPPFPVVAEVAARLRREHAAVIGLAEAAERLARRGYRKPASLLRDALAEAHGFTL